MDYFITAALVDELNEFLAGGRVQDILEIDEVSVGMEIYNHHTRHYLYMSADPEEARIHLTEGKLRRGVTTSSPLGLLLNRHLEGGRVMAVRQPAWERIVIVDFMTPDGEFSLIVEPIERRTNLVLMENGIIRECIRRVGANENRVRQLLPGQPYQPPPPQDKIEPAQVNIDTLRQILEKDRNAKVPSALAKGIHGLSPLLAREITFIATGDPATLAADASPRELYDAFQQVITPLLNHQWQPGYTFEKDEVTTFSVYPITHRKGWYTTKTVSEAMEKFYGVVSGDEAYEAAKKPIRKQIKDARKRLNGKLHNLQRQQQERTEIEFLRQAGELILAYQYQVKRGDVLLEAQYDPEGEPLKIKLDPLTNAVENAKRYFEKYDRAKRAVKSVPDMIEAVEDELNYLDQLEIDLDLATNWSEIGEVQEALQESGYWRGTKFRQTTNSGKTAPIKVVTDDGTLIWVGRNARQNEDVTFNKGTQDDIWMHARGIPGSHVIIKTNGRKVSEEVLRTAASLAAYYSKARHEGKVDVIVTERRQIRKVKGGKPGMVRVMKETLPGQRVTPKPAEHYQS